MRRCVVAGLLILSFAVAPVKADVGPPPPRPPPPTGPDKASIRGVGVQQVYTYWRGRRWMTAINGCASSQPACSGRDVSSCFVVGANGHAIDGGDIALLMASEKSVGASPIKLMLENCSPNEIELKP
jgi:hypothetical protein